MHPWGKWGRNFVEYGVAAAKAALADAGVAWRRRPVRLGRRHDPKRLPRLRRRCHLRPGARVDRRPGLELLRGVRLGCHRHRGGPGADPRRPLRRRPGGRRRHHPEGLLRPGRRRPQGRPGLAALPPARVPPTPPTSPSTRGGAWSCSAPPSTTSPPSRSRTPATAWPTPMPVTARKSPSRRCWRRPWWPTPCACWRSAPPLTAAPPWCSAAPSTPAAMAEVRARRRSPPCRR